MNKIKAINLINSYMGGWVNKNKSLILSVLNDDIVIKECYGPEYRNKKQIIMWMEYLMPYQDIMEFTMKEAWYDQEQEVLTYSWNFTQYFNDNADSFQGLSVIKFKNELISSIDEYKSSKQHSLPDNFNDLYTLYKANS